VEAVKAIRKTKNFEPLAVSFKRIRKIVEKAGAPSSWRAASVNSELFEQPAERALYDAARATAKRAAYDKRGGKYREALQSIADLRPLVDRFFDDVMVMSENEAVRRNRLTMLAELLEEFSTVADFSEIATGDSR
jgi:glycyl-tRNA synthetase beta chain